MSPQKAAAIVHLQLSRGLSMDATRACEVLGRESADWLGVRVDADGLPPGTRRYQTDLSLPIRGRTPQMVLRKAAYVDLGVARPTADGCELEISWRSATLAPLFPVFVGRLSVSGRELSLEGFYAPPGGDLGLVLDRALLGIAARGTARWFLERVAEAFGDAAEAVARPAASNATAGRPPTPRSQPRLSRASGNPQGD